MNNSQKAFELGQSLWYDNIERKLLDNGELAKMIAEEQFRGITSNPSIFNNAIVNSSDYDDELRKLVAAGKSTLEIYEALAIRDIQEATDLFSALYKESKGGDGYVSLEVNPALANDTESTAKEAERLWQTVDRPNLMVKIPATRAGLPAIRQTIAKGINVNVTLIFSIERYRAVMGAYLSGLEDRHNQGLPIENIASVASFFVSRIDSAVDKALDAVGSDKAKALQGKIAIASAKLAYEAYLDVLGSERFAVLKQAGATAQRPLWASTSTKNPDYPDTLYVDNLIGENTVNTVPPDTLVAFNQHGTAKETLTTGLDEAKSQVETLEELGVSLAAVTQALEEEGVKKFSEAFEELLQAIETRKQTV